MAGGAGSGGWRSREWKVEGGEWSVEVPHTSVSSFFQLSMEWRKRMGLKRPVAIVLFCFFRSAWAASALLSVSSALTVASSRFYLHYQKVHYHHSHLIRVLGVVQLLHPVTEPNPSTNLLTRT